MTDLNHKLVIGMPAGEELSFAELDFDKPHPGYRHVAQLAAKLGVKPADETTRNSVLIRADDGKEYDPFAIGIALIERLERNTP